MLNGFNWLFYFVNLFSGIEKINNQPINQTE